MERSYIGSSVVPFRFVFIMWLVYAFEIYTNIDLSFLGITPRTPFGLIGIFTAPMLHATNFPSHIISNTIPLLFLGGTLFFFYNKIGRTVFFRCYFITNILVWAFAGLWDIFVNGYVVNRTHIGASGLVYALSTFLIFFGLLRKDVMSLMISAVVLLLYGGIFYGVLPNDPMISWESHLFGAIVGSATAFSLRHTKKV